MTRHALARAVLAVAVAMPAQAMAQQAPPRPGIGPERPFDPPPPIERTLGNGLRVVALRHATVPKVTAILTIRSGLAVEPAARAGLAQFVADAVQQGTTGRDSEAIQRAIFGMGASLSGFAGQDSSSFQMRGLRETLPEMLALIADVVRNPTFPQGEIDLMKTTAAQRLQAQLASPQFLNHRQFRRTLFGDHPYARVGTTPETLAAIDRDTIAQYHSTYYRPNNAFLVVVGDLEPDAVFAAADQAFSGWTRADVPVSTTAPPPAQRGRRLVFVQRPNSVQSSISVGNLTLPRNDRRWYALHLANQVFGASFDSRLVRKLREEKGYTYSPQSVFQAMGQAGFYRAVADVRSEVTGATLTEIFLEIEKLRTEGPGTEELRAAKAYARGVFVLQNATQDGLAATISTVQTFGLPKEYPTTFQVQISQPSPEAVQAAAQVLLGSEHSVVVIVGDYAQVKGQLTGFADIAFVDISGAPIPEPQ